MFIAVLLRSKVRGAQQRIPGSDIGSPQGPTMAQSGTSFVLETKVAGSLLEIRQVKRFRVSHVS